MTVRAINFQTTKTKNIFPFIVQELYYVISTWLLTPSLSSAPRYWSLSTALCMFISSGGSSRQDSTSCTARKYKTEVTSYANTVWSVTAFANFLMTFRIKRCHEWIYKRKYLDISATEHFQRFSLQYYLFKWCPLYFWIFKTILNYIYGICPIPYRYKKVIVTHPLMPC